MFKVLGPDDDHISDDYRNGKMEMMKRLAGVSSREHNYSDDFLRGMIMALEATLYCLKGLQLSNRKEKRFYNTGLKLVDQ